MNRKQDFSVSGQIVDVVGKRIVEGSLIIRDGHIVQIEEGPVNEKQFLLPGLIDAHVHIESSMLTPVEFARLAVVHGTVATVSDPHEIANVMGVEGVNYMIESGLQSPLKFSFGVPSCVPATPFESSGAQLRAKDVDALLSRPDIVCLAEMMNFPGVLGNDTEVIAKLQSARKYGKPVDGHAPGLQGDAARQYAEAGISTDHECYTLDEAREKIRYGMKVQIREGSAARNFDELIPILKEAPDSVMFCSDDKHPDELVSGHINRLVKRALKQGYDLMEVIRACSYVPVKHYNLPVGLLQEGDPADFIVVNSLEDFAIDATYIDGEKVAEAGKTLIPGSAQQGINCFHAEKIDVQDLAVPAQAGKIRVQQAMDGQLITPLLWCNPKVQEGYCVSDTDTDILKMVVLNRYEKAQPAVGFVKGFGLKRGAIASTVAHDSHNIIAVGANDRDLVAAINLLVESKGGIVVVDQDDSLHLPLAVAGLMSDLDGYQVAKRYEALDDEAKRLGSLLSAPFMTLSFMALLVIPELKLSDKGLFDTNKFEFVMLYE